MGILSYTSQNNPTPHFLWEDVRLALDPRSYENLRRWAGDHPKYLVGDDDGITESGVIAYKE